MTGTCQMDSALFRTVVLLITLRWTFSHSDPGVSMYCDEDDEVVTYFLSEGESLRYVPEVDDLKNHFSWYWSTSQGVLPVPTEEAELVHAHGPVLFMLNATWGRPCCFMAREKKQDGNFTDHFLQVSVVPYNSSQRIFTMPPQGRNFKIDCPKRVWDTCDHLNGTLSWYKDSVLLPDQLSKYVMVSDAWTEDEYDCVCTWTHQQHLYRSVGTKRAPLKEPSDVLDPVEILSPAEEEQLADAGARLLLNCSVLCGTNIPHHKCRARWLTQPPVSEGYDQTTQYSPSGLTIVTAVLTIVRLSAKDFERHFECEGMGPYGDPVRFPVHLRPRQSMGPLMAVGTCVFLLCVIMAIIMKCFCIDLVLLFRRFIPFSLKDSGVKVFDAYVVYPLHHQDKPTEEALTQFISRDLPCILEEQCGYRLFILGRDDLPGEDRVELVEERIRMSRRLIVILPPNSEVTETYHQPDGYDWQVGLHEVLVQRDLSVILIELGDTGPREYSHLPPALHHLTQSSAPIRWPLKPQAARANSRFWKRVRYLMPAAPVRGYPLSPSDAWHISHD